MSRPENQLPPEFFYNETEAKKYTNATRLIKIQSQMTERALELMNLPNEPCLILDIGCGSGLSGDILTENGHHWVGMDISRSMMEVATERGVDGDMFEMDMGQGVPFRAGVFDGVVSISALQWLCVAGKKNDNPFQRLRFFFQSLYNTMKNNSRAVFQFYPENSQQVDMITSAALKCSFTGSVIVDYPHSAKARKIYLILVAGDQGGAMEVIMTKDQEEEEEEETNHEGREEETIPMHKKSKAIKKFKRRGKEKLQKKSRVWIQKKKDRQRAQGKEVKRDSKYTGRKRSWKRYL